MSLLFGVRFDFRNPTFTGTTPAQRYEAALEMAEWADGLGCMSMAISEHHGSPDGYLPSPVVMAAALAARTTNLRFMIAALIAPFYELLRLAEDLVVLDRGSNHAVTLFLRPQPCRPQRALDTVALPLGQITQVVWFASAVHVRVVAPRARTARHDRRSRLARSVRP